MVKAIFFQPSGLKSQIEKCLFCHLRTWTLDPLEKQHIIGEASAKVYLLFLSSPWTVVFQEWHSVLALRSRATDSKGCFSFVCCKLNGKKKREGKEFLNSWLEECWLGAMVKVKPIMGHCENTLVEILCSSLFSAANKVLKSPGYCSASLTSLEERKEGRRGDFGCMQTCRSSRHCTEFCCSFSTFNLSTGKTFIQHLLTASECKNWQCPVTLYPSKLRRLNELQKSYIIVGIFRSVSHSLEGKSSGSKIVFLNKQIQIDLPERPFFCQFLKDIW